MNLHSIKWRLQLWHGFLLVALVAGLMTGFYSYVRREKIQTLDNELSDAAAALLPQFAQPARQRGPEGPGPGQRPPPRDRFDEGPPPGEAISPRPTPPRVDEMNSRFVDSGRIYFAVWSERGDLLASSTNAPVGLVRPRRDSDSPGRQLRTEGTHRELIHFTPSGRSLVVGAATDAIQAALNKLAVALALIGSTIVLVGLTVGWWLVARSLRPISEISRAALDIAAGDLSKRISSSETESELGQLVGVLNSTFARLETAFAQQQQFTADAAHELRTPVAVILTQTQSALARDRSAADYRETLEACQRAAHRMKRLIESLLELTRFDAGQEQLQRSTFDLATKTRECIDLLQPLAAERQVKILSELTEAQCAGDPERLSQVVINLLTNAVTYNKPGGEVRVRTALQNGSVILTVADTGAGIAATDAPHVFKRFYRADKSRAGGTGNAGLGLAICQSIVTAHGGTLDFTSEPGQGTTFTLRLPAV